MSTWVPWLDISYHQLGANPTNPATLEAQARKVNYRAPGERGVQAIQMRLGNANRTPSAPTWDANRMADYSAQLFAEGYRAAGMTNLHGYWWPNPTASLPTQASVMRESYRRAGIQGPITLDMEDSNRATPATWAAVIDYLVKAAEDHTQQACLIYTADWWWNTTLAGYNANWSTKHNLEAEYPSSQRPPNQAAQWQAWITARKPAGPSNSKGWVGWDSWQFSSSGLAGDFGFPTGNSAGLDCNLAKPEAFAIWFPPPVPEPTPPKEAELYAQVQGRQAVFNVGGGTCKRVTAGEIVPSGAKIEFVSPAFFQGLVLLGPIPGPGNGMDTYQWQASDFAPPPWLSTLPPHDHPLPDHTHPPSAEVAEHTHTPGGVVRP